MSVILQLTPPALAALTTARRSHDRPHNTEAPLPLMSFNNSSAVGRVTCLFQAHGLSENSLCMCTSVNARVNCAVSKNRVHQGSGSCMDPIVDKCWSVFAIWKSPTDPHPQPQEGRVKGQPSPTTTWKAKGRGWRRGGGGPGPGSCIPLRNNRRLSDSSSPCTVHTCISSPRIQRGTW